MTLRWLASCMRCCSETEPYTPLNRSDVPFMFPVSTPRDLQGTGVLIVSYHHPTFRTWHVSVVCGAKRTADPVPSNLADGRIAICSFRCQRGRLCVRTSVRPSQTTDPLATSPKASKHLCMGTGKVAGWPVRQALSGQGLLDAKEQSSGPSLGETS